MSLNLKFNSFHDDFCFFDARVKASMTRSTRRIEQKLDKTKQVKLFLLNALVKLALMDIVNMLGPYYMPYLTSLNVALGRCLQTLLAHKGLSSGINQPNEHQTFQFFSKMLRKERRLKKGLKGKTRKWHIHHVPPLLYRLQENRLRTSTMN